METPSQQNRKSLWFVLILSFTYMVAEIIGGVLSGSLALLADAGHMATDVAAIALGLFAIWVSQKPPSETKTFGYYRAEILAALVNGAALVAIACWIFYEAFERLSHPKEVNGIVLTSVAFGGLLVNLVALALTHRGSGSSLNIRGVWLHILSDTLGSVGAVLAGFFVWQFQWYFADPIISIAIGLLVLFSSWKLLKDCVNVLLEGVPKGMDLSEIRRELEALPDIEGVHDLHVWTVTSGVIALSAHLKIKDGEEYPAVLKRVTTLIREKFAITHSTVQLECSKFSHQESCQSHF